MTQGKIIKLPEMQEKIKTSEKEEKPDNNLTISTKLSTDQLICKTPQESPNASVKSIKSDEIGGKRIANNNDPSSYLLYLGTSQILLGLLMAVFGMLVIIHNAKLSQLGGGLWGGCLAVASGTTGVLAAAKNWCPLKNSAQKVAHTAFLALSLISVAVSQLVLVLAATGLARDLNTDFTEETEEVVTTPHSVEVFVNLPPNYMALLSNVGLLIVSGIECVCATIASYRSSRALCPCFRNPKEITNGCLQTNSKAAFVNSWLGKHSLQPPFYVVAAPTTGTGKRSRISSNLTITPMLPLPPPVLPPQIMGYPLIPAPLGPVPSPIIQPFHKELLHRKHKRRHSTDHNIQKSEISAAKSRRSKSKSREKSITTEEVVRTYTGLDRTIAEEFIEICDSRNNSLCSDSSCQNSDCTGSHAACTSVCNTNSDVTSRNEKL